MKAARGPFAKEFPRPNTEDYLPLQFIKQFVCWSVVISGPVWPCSILTYRLKYINLETADATNLFITDAEFKEFFLDSLYIMGYLVNVTIEMLNREYDEIKDNRYA
jgi:hypothetical protein